PEDQLTRALCWAVWGLCDRSSLERLRPARSSAWRLRPDPSAGRRRSASGCARLPWPKTFLHSEHGLEIFYAVRTPRGFDQQFPGASVVHRLRAYRPKASVEATRPALGRGFVGPVRLKFVQDIH